MSTVTRALLVLAALLLGAPLIAAPAAAASEPIPEWAKQRLDRVAAALADDPLFVDPDLAGALDAGERDRVRTVIESTAQQIGAPVYVVVIPNRQDSESQGRDRAFLDSLHDRVGDGLYLMAGTSATFEIREFGVPRRELYIDDDRGRRPADSENRFADLADRMALRLQIIAAAPSERPRTPRPYGSTDPFGQENRLRPVEPEIAPPLVTGLLFGGPIAAAVLYWIGLGVLGRRGRGRLPAAAKAAPRSAPDTAGEAYPDAPESPSARWLRRTGSRELERLRALLPDSAGNPGREYAASAYDVAQILYDDVAEDADRPLDLTGVIVLARMGRAALQQRTAAPRPPCSVNPLHGESVLRRKIQLGDGPARRRPLCRSCTGQTMTTLARRTLKAGGPGGAPVPYHAVPGVWRDTAFGADGGQLIPRIQEYLGVE